MNEKIIAMIPARYGSSRFPGKPLASVLGRPMIQWVYERTAEAKNISEVYVATDDIRIYDAVNAFGGLAIMTGECRSGSDRLYQASKKISYDIVINVQGDEPTIRSDEIDELAEAFLDRDVYMATLKKAILEPAEIKDPNIVKVVTDKFDNALLFSRYSIPYNREKCKDIKYYKHIGIYGYRRTFLKIFAGLPESTLEKTEKLEQLRVLENGYKIKVLETEYETIGVDLPEHISLVEKNLQKELGILF